MAEATAAASVGRRVVRQPIWLEDDGTLRLRCACTIPGPRRSARLLSLFASRTVRGLRYALHPFSRADVFAVGVSLFVGLVLASPSESWLRAGAPASAVWAWSEARLPWPHGAATTVRVGVLAAAMAVPALLLLAWAQRSVLWLLLCDSAWLRAARSPTLYVRGWFAAVHALTRGAPLTESFQTSLPRQPVPQLRVTVNKLLQSARLLQDDTAYAATAAAAEAFMAAEGPKLQRLLVLRSFFVPSYNADWWERYVYLKSRDALLINSNYYVLDSAAWKPTHNQAARAAVLVYNMCLFKDRLESQRVAPILVHNTVPLCMKQYERMFATTRVPGREQDELVHYDAQRVGHIAVACNGSFYTLEVYTRQGCLRAPDELEDDFAAILRDAHARSPAPRAGEACLPALTGQNRTRWAEVREAHFSDGLNRRSLNAIERAIVYVSLEDVQFDDADWSGRARALLHGNRARPNIWADKSLSLVVFANGKAGVNAEHSWADALVVSHLLEESIVLSEGGSRGVLPSGAPGTAVPGLPSNYSPEGHALPATGPTIGCGVRGHGTPLAWRRLPWALTVEAEAAVATAVTTLQAAADSVELVVAAYETYGKGFIKKCGVSPDAYVQAALQLAHYRDTAATHPQGKGEFVATYESTMARLFLHGRTETCRPLTAELCAFVDAMQTGASLPAPEKLRLLQRAATRHVAGYTDAMTGAGCDRHAFALYCVASGLGIDSPFLKSALSVPWRLSTSQQPQQQTDLWDIRDPIWQGRISPGGGFGPVSSLGYGVSYMIQGEQSIFFHISARAGGRTNAARFQRLLFETLNEMQSVMQEALKLQTKE